LHNNKSKIQVISKNGFLIIKRINLKKGFYVNLFLNYSSLKNLYTQITPMFLSYNESILKIKFVPSFFGHCYVSKIFLNDINF